MVEHIYSYLKTFPRNITVGELVDNIDKAKKIYSNNLEKRQAAVNLNKLYDECKEKYLNKAFYYTDIDTDEFGEEMLPIEDAVFVKSIKLSYENDIELCCDVIMIDRVNNTVSFEENVTIPIEDMEKLTPFPADIFTTYKETFDEFIHFSFLTVD